ncbi:MAG: hypothetical protein ACN6PN_23735 [Sphingobacterium sp.]
MISGELASVNRLLEGELVQFLTDEIRVEKQKKGGAGEGATFS